MSGVALKATATRQASSSRPSAVGPYTSATMGDITAGRGHFHHLDAGPWAWAMRSSSGRRRWAMAWLWSLRWCLSTRLTCKSPLLGIGAEVVLAHQPVEGDGAGRAGASPGCRAPRGRARNVAAMSCKAAAVFPAGASGHVHHHLEFALVVEGQHFQHHGLDERDRHRQQQGRQNADQQQPAFARAGQQRRERAAEHRLQPAPDLAGAVGLVARAGVMSLSASQGVTVKAMPSDSAMPMLELMGMGLMYGPIRPDTKAIGSRAQSPSAWPGWWGHPLHRPHGE